MSNELLEKLIAPQKREQAQKDYVKKQMVAQAAEKAVKGRLDEFAEQTPTEDLLLKTKTANKAREEGQKAASTQKTQQAASDPSRSVLSKLMISIGAGMAAAGGSEVGVSLIGDLLKSQMTASKTNLTPEMQVATLEQTRALIEEAGINATVGVTATGVPTISVAPTGGVESLIPEQQVSARDLARRLYGVRGAEKGLPGIVKSLQAGKTIDEIEDTLRYAQQSKEFSGGVRGAAQQIMVGKSKSATQQVFDGLDDLVEDGDVEGIKSYMKRMSVKNAPTTEAQNVNGMERTVELLTEIQGDLDGLERLGMPTGFWSGTVENMLSKVGQVKDPEKRRVATKIAVAVMNYRRAMTGVQFGMKEHIEYKAIFPNIDKVGDLNKANIDALKGTFQGNLDKFYSLSMGEDNYENIFKMEKSAELPVGYSADEWEEIQ